MLVPRTGGVGPFVRLAGGEKGPLEPGRSAVAAQRSGATDVGQQAVGVRMRTCRIGLGGQTLRASPAGLGRPFVEKLLACRDDFSDVAKFFCRLSRRGLVGLPGGFSQFVGKNFSVWRKVLVQTEGDICRLGKSIRETGGSDGGCLPHGRGVRPPKSWHASRQIVARIPSQRDARPVASVAGDPFRAFVRRRGRNLRRRGLAVRERGKRDVPGTGKCRGRGGYSLTNA